MTPTSVTATPAGSVSAPTAAPGASPASADFLALLLLTIGVGTGTSQSEADTADQGANDSEPDLTTLGTTASVALASTMSMTTPMPLPAPLPEPLPEPVIEPAAAPANEAAPSIAASTATEMITPATIDAPDTTSAPRAARGEHAPSTDTAAPAPEAHHALAELSAGKLDAAADATRTATSEVAVESAPAPRPVIDTTTRQTASKNDPREADRGADAAAPTSAAKPAPVTATARPETMASSSKPEAAEHHPAPATKPEPMVHGADVVALHAHAEVTPRAVTVDGPASASAAPAPAGVVEPQVVADQIVRAARLVVDDGLAQMRVDLQPPTLGAVRVQADVRGEVVMLTITAERPETQALLTQALPDIQQALVRRDVGPTSVAIIGSTTTPLSSDGRRAPERRPETPRERPSSNPGERRRTLRASRAISAVDITV